MGPGQMDHVGRKVRIRHPVGDITYLEVYLDGKWLCTAYPAATLDDASKQTMQRERSEQYREARRLQSEAVQIRRRANGAVDDGQATPAVGEHRTVDALRADPDELYDLLAEAERVER